MKDVEGFYKSFPLFVKCLLTCFVRQLVKEYDLEKSKGNKGKTPKGGKTNRGQKANAGKGKQTPSRGKRSKGAKGQPSKKATVPRGKKGKAAKSTDAAVEAAPSGPSETGAAPKRRRKWRGLSMHGRS